MVFLGESLSNEEVEGILATIKDNADVVAWEHKNMVGIDPCITKHHLYIREGSYPVKQKLRRIYLERSSIVKTEVDKLLATRFICEVQYLKWLANIVVVPKKNDKWRICVDYSDLNEACLNDSFSLSIIDHIVDAKARNELFSFMDAYSRYN